MRKTLSGIAALTLFDIVAAQAQPVVPPVPVWSGFYVGAHAGYRWGASRVDWPSAGFDSALTGTPTFGFLAAQGRTSNTLSGGSYGFQAGYDITLPNRLLLGAVADLSLNRRGAQSASSANPGAMPGFVNSWTSSSVGLTTDWSSTVRARFGQSFGDVLLYVTGGVAFTRASATAQNAYTLQRAGDGVVLWTASADTAASKTLIGSAFGAGAEYQFANGWSAQVEYIYENYGTQDFGTMAYALSNGGAPVANQLAGPLRAHLEFNTIRFGINKKL